MRSSYERDCVRGAPAVGVEQRNRMQEYVFILGLVEQSYMQSVKMNVPVGKHYSLGIGTGPARVKKFAERILVEGTDVSAVRRCISQELFIVFRSEPLGLRSRIEQVVRTDGGQLRAKRIDYTYEILSQKQLGRARIVQDVAKFMRRETVIERQQDGSGIEDSKVRLQQAMTIHAEKRDSIPCLHSGRAQRAGQPGRPISELRVSKSLVLANYRRLVWKLLFRITEEAHGRERNIHR